MPAANDTQYIALPQFPDYVFSTEGIPRRARPARRGVAVGSTVVNPCKTKGGKKYYLLRDKDGRRTSVFPETVRTALATADVPAYALPGYPGYLATADGFLYRKLPTGALRALKPEFRDQQMRYLIWRDCKRTVVSSTAIQAMVAESRDRREMPDILPAAAPEDA